MRCRRGRPLRAALLIYTGRRYRSTLPRQLLLDSGPSTPGAAPATGFFTASRRTRRSSKGRRALYRVARAKLKNSVRAGCQEIMVRAWGGTVDAYEQCSLSCWMRSAPPIIWSSNCSTRALAALIGYGTRPTCA